MFSQTGSDSEPCQSLVNVVANPQCVTLSNCTGLTCDLQGNSILNGSRATFSVTKCVDPVTVDLSIPSFGLWRRLNQTDTIFYNPQESIVSAVISRNATHLRFQVSWSHKGSGTPWDIPLQASIKLWRRFHYVLYYYLIPWQNFASFITYC